MSTSVHDHYQRYPYPRYPLLASVRRCDTYALNLTALWEYFNHTAPPPAAQRILIAGSGTFSPYPWALANPHLPITAVDLSSRSLRRAFWHCTLHGRTNVAFRTGCILDSTVYDGTYGIIDSFGVLHHLSDPLQGLKKLTQHLAPGGILRIMLYNRYARREEESIRRAFKLLGISSHHAARALLNKAAPGSRLAAYLAAADEPHTVSGLADALLHPQVHTFRIDDLLALVADAGLTILRFAHHGALEEPDAEIARLRAAEQERQAPDNFIVYLGAHRAPFQTAPTTLIALNPCLTSAVGAYNVGTLHIANRIGIRNPPLRYADRSFLRRFNYPQRRDSLTSSELQRVAVYKQHLFLLEYTPFS